MNNSGRGVSAAPVALERELYVVAGFGVDDFRRDNDAPFAALLMMHYYGFGGVKMMQKY